MKKITMIIAVLGLTMMTGCGHATHTHAKNDKACADCAGHKKDKAGCTDCGDKTASAGCPDCKTAATK